MKKLLIVMLLVLSLLPLVSAFGIGSSYWKENPLVMQPGESKDFYMVLQNAISTEDIRIKVDLVEGSGIVNLTDSNLEYLVPAGATDVKVNLRAVVSADAVIGTTYPVMISFTALGSTQGGGISMGASIEKSFSVVVGEVKEETKAAMPMSTLAMIIAVIVVVAIVLAIPKKKKRK